MTVEAAAAICKKYFSEAPQKIERFSNGLGNYVFYVQLQNNSYVLRCQTQPYDQTFSCLEKLCAVGIPVPSVIAHGEFQGMHYMISEYIDGDELGDIYPQLSDTDKRNIAAEVIEIQRRAAAVPIKTSSPLIEWVTSMLDRARDRITVNGYFDPALVDKLIQFAAELREYFENLKPATYLDDISTKNLIIRNGHVSGIIDVDWLECGDPLTFIALTNMALLNFEYNTDYVNYLLEEMHITPLQYQAFCFYSLLYCVDFMGERGSTFMGRTVPVDENIVYRLNCIYEQLCREYYNLKEQL